MKTRRDTPTQLLPAGAATGLNPAVLFGILIGLLFLTGFMYPAGAYPLQAILFSGIMMLAAGGICLRLWLGGGMPRTLMADCLGSLPALSLFLFILWAALRWRQAEVPALARDWIAALASLGVAFVLGCGTGALDRAEPAAPSVLTIFARVAALGAIGFGIYALYQYFIEYPESARALRSLQTSPIADLRTQSLLHALEMRRVAGRLGNPNLFAAQLALFVFLCLAAWRQPTGRIWRVAAVLGVAAGVVGLLLSQSRGGMLTLLLAAAILALPLLFGRGEARTGRIRLLAVMLLFIFSLGAVSSAWAAGGGLLERLGNIETIRERLYYWEIALKVWARHPLIGEGPGGFSLLYLIFKSPVARESQYAHSWFFQIGSELGLVGLGIFGVAWAGLVARVGSAWRRGALHPDALWCLGGVLILLFNGLFEFSLQWPAFLSALGLLGGLTCGLTGRVRYDEVDGRNVARARWRGVAGGALALAVAILGLWAGLPYYVGERYQGDAEAQLDDGNWNAAAEQYRRALWWRPDDPALHLALAGTLGQFGAAPEAWEQLAEAARLNPHSAAVRGAQADWLAARGQVGDALRMMGQAIELYPSNVAYRLGRARLNLKAGKPAEARMDLELIERERLPVWEFQQGYYNDLRVDVGLKRIPAAEIPK